MLELPHDPRLSAINSSYRDARVLVTGGAGSIGSCLVRILSLAGSQVLILDDLSSSVSWNVPEARNISFVKGSITDEQSLQQVFERRPDFVFHLASFFANQNSIEFPESDLDVNGLGILKVLQYSAKSKVKRLVYTSSSCVYHASEQVPFEEHHAAGPYTTPYAVTKYLGELYCDVFLKSWGLPTVKARLFNSYGPGELPGRYRNVIPNFISRAMQGVSLCITGSGDETRDFTFVTDIVKGLLLCGTCSIAPGESINLGTGTETKIRDLARLINEATGNSAGIEMIQRRSWDTTSRRVASIEKARSVLGYEPFVTLREGITATVNWFRQNWDRMRRTEK